MEILKIFFIYRFQRSKSEILLWSKVEVILSDKEKLSIPLFFPSEFRAVFIPGYKGIGFC